MASFIPDPDEIDADAAVFYESLAMNALAEGDTGFADYFWDAARFYEDAIESRRSGRISDVLGEMARRTGREASW